MNNRTTDNLIAVLRECFAMFTVKPKAIDVRVVEMQRTIQITVTPDIKDYGPLIGSKGVMFNAIQCILQEIGTGMSKFVRYSVVKPEGDDLKHRPKFKASEAWNNEPLAGLARRIGAAIFDSATVEARDMGDTTALTMLVDCPATRNLEPLNAALNVLFHAVGKANGRNEVLAEVVRR